MTRFVEVTDAQMGELLCPKGFVHVALDGVSEVVYGRGTGTGYMVAVLTGIVDGKSRAKGDDAIRVALVKGGRILTTLPHIKRQANWRERLKARLSESDRMLCEQPCPACKGPLVLRRGTRGEFYGCVSYPKCRGLREI